MTSPDLTIIIVNWNTGPLLLECIESIRNSRLKIPFEVLVIDNASTDESIALLKQSECAQSLAAAERLRVIHNKENVGFGTANNQAFALSRSPFVFLLNPDANLYPDTIEILMQTVSSDDRIAACGPRILNQNGSVQTSVYFNPPAAWHTFMWQLKLYKLLPSNIRGNLLLGYHWDHSTRRDVPMLIGAAMLVRREVIDQVGGFNESFHMYAEDNEWCWRIRRAGWRLVFEPAAMVTHLGGQSSLKRWSADEKLKTQLESSFKFEQLALSRPGLIRNQLANYLVVTAQLSGRKLLGANLGQLRLIRMVHRRHLAKSLKMGQEVNNQ